MGIVMRGTLGALAVVALSQIAIAEESGPAQVELNVDAQFWPIKLTEGAKKALNRPLLSDNNSGKETDRKQASGDLEILQEIIVTGSQLKRTNLDGPAPVIVFDRAKIDQLSVTNVADVLNYLPQQTFSTNERFNPGGSRVVRLRGLGLGTTLILVNGRRTVTSALTGAGNYFDVNTIPLPAVERVEVLADSASAIYGTDAIGGVVNIILKDSIHEPTLDLQYGTAQGGGEERRASIGFGVSGRRFDVTAVMDFFDRDHLFGKERERFANADFRRFGGSDYRVLAANPGNVCSTTGDNLPGLSSPCAAIPKRDSGANLMPADFAGTDGAQNLESLGRFSSIVPKAQRKSFSGSATLHINERVHGFTEFLFADRNDTRIGSPIDLYDIVVPAGNPFNPFGEDVFVSYLVTEVPSTRTEIDAKSYRTTAGLRGDIGSWDWEGSVLNIQEKALSREVNRSIDFGLLENALASTDPNEALNLFNSGGASSKRWASLVEPTIDNVFRSTGTQASGFVRGTLLSTRAGNVQAIVGIEGREEKIHIESRPFLIMTADRESSSAYTEVRVPLFSRSTQEGQASSVTLTAAGRYDHYSDFGGAFNPQFGLEWTLRRGWLWRASYGTSFRAPSLFELYQPAITLPGSLIRDPRRGNEIASFTTTFGGERDLKPEEARSLVTGFVWTPHSAALPALAVSYWRISQEQRVARLDPGMLLANEGFFSSRIIRMPQTPQDVVENIPGALDGIIATNINFGSLKTSGVDLQLNHRIATPLGHLTTNLATTWVARYDAADFPNTPIVDRVGVANSQGTISRWRTTLGLGWGRGALDLNVTARYSPSYDDADDFNSITGQRVNAQTLVDLYAGLDFDSVDSVLSTFFRGTVLRFGVTNVFDERPPFSEVGFSLGYDPSQVDARQRFFSASITKKFN